MDRDEALKLLKGGPEGIREWNLRRKAGEALPDLVQADLTGADLNEVNLQMANLIAANLTDATLRGANLSRAILSDARLLRTNLSNSICSCCNLNGSHVGGGNFRMADFSRATFPQLRFEAPISRGLIFGKRTFV